MIRFPATLAVAFLPLALAACAGPKLAPVAPPSAPPARFSAGQADSAFIRDDAVRLDWWKDLGDPALDALVSEALERNADLRAASANLRAAQALVREARSLGLPSGGIAASAELNRTPGAALQLDTIGGPSVLPTQTLADIGGTLSWELDLAGRLDAIGDAAGADAEKARWLQRAAQAAVAANVVRAWFDLAAAEERLAITGKRRALLAGIATSLADAERLGGVRPDEPRRVRIALAQLDAQAEQVRFDRRNALRRLATLRAIHAPDGLRAAPPAISGPLPVPQFVRAPRPEQVLRLRPDVAIAELELLRTNAEIRIARADLYPRISFGGSAGLTAEPRALGTAGALRFGIGPSITWGIFDMGRIRARIRASGEKAQAAGAAWEGAVLRAVEETDRALDGYAAMRRMLAQAEAVDGDAQKMVQAAEVGHAAGLTSSVAAARARDEALVTRQMLLDAQQAARSAWLECQLALGGGWH